MTTNTKANATPAKTSPAKAASTRRKAAVQPVEEPVVAEHRAFCATGRAGKTCTRHYVVVMTHAVDVADTEARSEAGRLGLIWSFHRTAEKAQKAADRYVAKGLDAVVVPAQVAR